MKRTVILTVDDDRTDHITVEQWRMRGIDSAECLSANVTHDVPPDDQLTRDLDTLRRYVHQTVEIGGGEDGNWMRPVESIPSGAEAWGAMNRITAAAGLNEGSEDEP